MDTISKEVTSKAIGDSKIELIETVDKAEYIAKCRGQLEHQYEIIEFAETKIEQLKAELTKYEAKPIEGK